MSLSISQDYINQLVEQERYRQNNTKAGQQFKQDCKEALKQWDYNGDGKTSAIEMYKSHSDIYKLIFEGNSKYAQEADKIALAQGELYAKFAGDDGILDEAEYNAALQSKENHVFIEQYWMLKDAMEAEENSNDITGLTRHDINYDGQVSAIEIFKDRSDLFEEVFKGDEEKLEKAKKIALSQAEILNKYAGEDGVLSMEEYANALRSEAFGKTMDEYLDLKNQMINFVG